MISLSSFTCKLLIVCAVLIFGYRMAYRPKVRELKQFAKAIGGQFSVSRFLRIPQVRIYVENWTLLFGLSEVRVAYVPNAPPCYLTISARKKDGSSSGVNVETDWAVVTGQPEFDEVYEVWVSEKVHIETAKVFLANDQIRECFLKLGDVTFRIGRMLRNEVCPVPPEGVEIFRLSRKEFKDTEERRVFVNLASNVVYHLRNIGFISDEVPPYKITFLCPSDG